MQSFKLGNFLIEPSKGAISSPAETVKVEPKAMAVLYALYLRAGEVVSHEELFEKVWPGRIYSPSLLQRTIALIRKALKESSHKPVYLHTHPKLGYRLERATAVVEKPSQSRGFTWLVLMKAISLFILMLVILYWFSTTWQPESKLTSQLISHGIAQETNGRISPNNKWVSYQSNDSVQVIHLAKLPELKKQQIINLKDEVVDHLWRDEKFLLAMMRNTQGQFYLSQIDIADTQHDASKTLVKFNQYPGIQQMALLDSTTLVFINNHKRLTLIKWDLLANQLISEIDLAEQAIHASLAVSKYDVYVHSFDGLKGHLTRVKRDGAIELIDLKMPLIADISWDDKNKHLVISDQLKAQQWRYTKNKLLSYTLSDTEILSGLTIRENLIVATQTRPNMDIFIFQKGKLRPIVQSKYLEHLGQINTSGKVAFISHRDDVPQIMVHQPNNETQAFDLLPKAELVSSLQWSVLDDWLAYSAGKTITLLNVSTGVSNSIHFPFEVNHIMSWSSDDQLLFTDSQARIYALIPSQDNYTLLEQPADIDYLAKDKFGNELGIQQDQVFWKDKTLAIQGNVPFANFSNNQLIIQVNNQKQAKLIVIDSQLLSQEVIELPNDCEFVTSAVFVDAKLSALCTKVNPADKDIVLIAPH